MEVVLAEVMVARLATSCRTDHRRAPHLVTVQTSATDPEMEIVQTLVIGQVAVTDRVAENDRISEIDRISVIVLATETDPETVNGLANDLRAGKIDRGNDHQANVLPSGVLQGNVHPDIVRLVIDPHDLDTCQLMEPGIGDAIPTTDGAGEDTNTTGGVGHPQQQLPVGS